MLYDTMRNLRLYNVVLMIILKKGINMNLSNCCKLAFNPNYASKIERSGTYTNELEEKQVKRLEASAKWIITCQVHIIAQIIGGCISYVMRNGQGPLLCLVPISLLSSKLLLEVYKIKKILDSNPNIVNLREPRK